MDVQPRPPGLRRSTRIMEPPYAGDGNHVLTLVARMMADARTRARTCCVSRLARDNYRTDFWQENCVAAATRAFGNPTPIRAVVFTPQWGDASPRIRVVNYGRDIPMVWVRSAAGVWSLHYSDHIPAMPAPAPPDSKVTALIEWKQRAPVAPRGAVLPVDKDDEAAKHAEARRVFGVCRSWLKVTTTWD